jgi:hypothetical protein
MKRRFILYRRKRGGMLYLAIINSVHMSAPVFISIKELREWTQRRLQIILDFRHWQTQ